MTQKLTPTPVRMNPDLRRWLQQQARQNHRSLNGEIIHRLEQTRQQHTQTVERVLLDDDGKPRKTEDMT